jgi:hypothetical protein
LGVFERFTDQARRAVVLAHEEARLFDHNYIGTEHLLLGLIRSGDGAAAQALESFEVELDAVRAQVVDLVGDVVPAPSGHLPFTPRAKKALELSLREALQLGHHHIGTEHLLLGLMREGEGIAAQILERAGAGLAPLRARVIELLDESGDRAPQSPSSMGLPPGDARQGTQRRTTRRSQRRGGVVPARCACCDRESPDCGALFTGAGGALICEECVANASSWRSRFGRAASSPFAGVPVESRLASNPPLEERMARVEATGPPPDDEVAARREIEHVVAHLWDTTEDGRGLEHVDQSDDLGGVGAVIEARYGQVMPRTSRVVDAIKFVDAGHAAIWFSISLDERPIGSLAHRELRMVLVDGQWKLTRESAAAHLALAGVVLPPFPTGA